MAKSKWPEIQTKLVLVEAWARDGLIDTEIAKNLGINVATLYRYKQEHCEICESLKRGKEIVDVEVENALLKKATGFKYTEQSAFKLKNVFYDEEGHRREKEELQVVDLEKYCPPETVAAIFWLKNRKPDTWRDKPVGTESAEDQINQNIQSIANLLNHPVKNRQIEDDEKEDG